MRDEVAHRRHADVVVRHSCFLLSLYLNLFYSENFISHSTWIGRTIGTAMARHEAECQVRAHTIMTHGATKYDGSGPTGTKERRDTHTHRHPVARAHPSTPTTTKWYLVDDNVQHICCCVMSRIPFKLVNKIDEISLTSVYYEEFLYTKSSSHSISLFFHKSDGETTSQATPQLDDKFCVWMKTKYRWTWNNERWAMADVCGGECRVDNTGRREKKKTFFLSIEHH